MPQKYQNLKQSRKFKKSSQLWLRRQLNDEYVEKAKIMGFRSRASFKIIEIDEKFKIFKKNKIDAVINAAGKVGGIYANNKYKADFIYDNLAIQNNVIHSCFQNKVKSLIFLGSSCLYARMFASTLLESDGNLIYSNCCPMASRLHNKLILLKFSHNDKTSCDIKHVEFVL